MQKKNLENRKLKQKEKKKREPHLSSYLLATPWDWSTGVPAGWPTGVPGVRSGSAVVVRSHFGTGAGIFTLGEMIGVALDGW
jgi:hypothetical protein